MLLWFYPNLKPIPLLDDLTEASSSRSASSSSLLMRPFLSLSVTGSLCVVVVTNATFSVVYPQWEMDRKCKVGINLIKKKRKKKTCWLLSSLKTDESGEESTGSFVDDAIPNSSELEFHSIYYKKQIKIRLFFDEFLTDEWHTIKF